MKNLGNYCIYKILNIYKNYNFNEKKKIANACFLLKIINTNQGYRQLKTAWGGN